MDTLTYDFSDFIVTFRRPPSLSYTDKRLLDLAIETVNLLRGQSMTS
ncbi:MAG: hypothetical protein RLZZ618_837 [Pseudomonadota bacterium]|jgi:hypothetical protein